MLIKGHKRKKGILTRRIAILLLFSTVIGLMTGVGTEEVEAASSYTDAVAFYESTGSSGGGGIGTPMGKQECRYDKTFTVWNCNYSKKGYKFIGWSLNPVSTGSFGLTQASTVNLYNTDTGIEAKLKEYVTVYNIKYKNGIII